MMPKPEHRLIRILRLLPVIGPAGVAKLAAARALGSPRTTVRIRGYGAPLTLRPRDSDLGVLRQTFVARDCDVDVPPPKWIVDAGAYVGFTAVFFAKRYPGARIIAIEPSPENVALLRENCARYPQVTVVEGALWYEPGSLELEFSKRGSWATQVRAATTGKVRAMTVSDVMKEHGIPEIDLLKIDIEGAEREIFSRPLPWLEKVGTLVCELHGKDCERAVLGAAGPERGWDIEHRGEKVVLRSTAAARRGVAQPA
jgi:FkbM family methyltransferase